MFKRKQILLSLPKRAGHESGPSPLFLHRKSERGSVLFYVFLAVLMLGSLTFMLADDSSQRSQTTSAVKMAEQFYAEIQVIQSAITECILTYPQGGGDEDGDGTIDTTDNPNLPYPLESDDPNNPVDLSASPVEHMVYWLQCPGVVTSDFNDSRIIGGKKGRYLSTTTSAYMDNGHGDGDGWRYYNDSNGVYLQIEGDVASELVAQTLNRLDEKFADDQAELNYDPGSGACGATCFTYWLKQN